ncbi:hypothetical protein ACS0TY_022562 [Phlomoides rotata]
MHYKEATQLEERKDFKILWNKFTPEKVRINAWRVLWKHIPTTTELLRRNALPPNAKVNCCFCDSSPESVRHIFFECSLSYNLWMECLNWIGIKTTIPSNPSSNLLFFSTILSGKRERCSYLYLGVYNMDYMENEECIHISQ